MGCHKGVTGLCDGGFATYPRFLMSNLGVKQTNTGPPLGGPSQLVPLIIVGLSFRPCTRVALSLLCGESQVPGVRYFLFPRGQVSYLKFKRCPLRRAIERYTFFSTFFPRLPCLLNCPKATRRLFVVVKISAGRSTMPTAGEEV